jgi:hypothetical protein
MTKRSRRAGGLGGAAPATNLADHCRRRDAQVSAAPAPEHARQGRNGRHRQARSCREQEGETGQASVRWVQSVEHRDQLRAATLDDARSVTPRAHPSPPVSCISLLDVSSHPGFTWCVTCLFKRPTSDPALSRELSPPPRGVARRVPASARAVTPSSREAISLIIAQLPLTPLLTPLPKCSSLARDSRLPSYFVAHARLFIAKPGGTALATTARAVTRRLQTTMLADSPRPFPNAIR